MRGRLHDDTALDAISSQVRSVARVDSATLGGLLIEARADPGGPATATLVEQQLGAVLDAVLQRGGSGLDLLDLYQEGSIAATVAVREYAGRGGRAAGLSAYVGRVVDTFLDDVVAREAAQRLADRLMVERVQLLETAALALRARLDREPTTLELAGALAWPPEQVEAVAVALAQARAAHDAEILAYLDDVDPGDEGDRADS